MPPDGARRRRPGRRAGRPAGRGIQVRAAAAGQAAAGTGVRPPARRPGRVANATGANPVPFRRAWPNWNGRPPNTRKKLLRGGTSSSRGGSGASAPRPKAIGCGRKLGMYNVLLRCIICYDSATLFIAGVLAFLLACLVNVLLFCFRIVVSREVISEFIHFVPLCMLRSCC